MAVRIGIVGLGRGLILTLPALARHPGVALTGVYDVRSDARDAFASEHGAVAFTSLDDMLASATVDAVYIATPHELHATQGIATARAGKHALIEKPMATTVADCMAMADAATAAGTVMMIGPSHGFDAPVQQAAAIVASGSYGAVRMVTAMNFTDFMYRPRRPEELDSSRGGGVVFSQAAHQIDVVRRIVGQPVATVRAVAGNWDAARLSEGAYTAFVTFSGGAVATLTYSGYAHYDSDELMDWISELGHPKDPLVYGKARQQLATIADGGESDAKAARTYQPGAGNPVLATAPHHEQFGFVLVSCERADLKLSPTGIAVYADDRRAFLPLAPPLVPRSQVIDAFLGAIAGNGENLHGAIWGAETVACCAALLRSSASGADVSPAEIIRALN